MSNLLNEWQRAQDRTLNDFQRFVDGALKEGFIDSKTFQAIIKSSLQLIYPNCNALADKLDYNRTTIERWSKGTGLPSPQTRVAAVTQIKDDVQTVRGQRTLQP